MDAPAQCEAPAAMASPHQIISGTEDADQPQGPSTGHPDAKSAGILSRYRRCCGPQPTIGWASPLSRRYLPAEPEALRSASGPRPPAAGLRRVGTGLRTGLAAAVAVLGLLQAELDAQGMAAAGRRDRPPVPLPDSLVPPEVDYLDIAADAGLAAHHRLGDVGPVSYLPETTGSGVALVDYDNDGLLDIYVVRSGTFRPAVGETARAPGRTGRTGTLYRNLGGLQFALAGRQAAGEAEGWGQGVCAGDFDADGFTDLFVTRWGRDSLLRNMDGSGFGEVTSEQAFPGGETRWSTGCSFLDFDRDGDLDLFVAHYVDFDLQTTPAPGDAPQCAWLGAPIPCGPRGLAAESMSLYANDGAGRFRDVTSESGVATRKRYYGLGVLASDFDGDGWTDVFVACDSTPNLLFRNSRDGTFEESGLTSGAGYSEDGQEQAGMGAAAADYDGDGQLDIFVTNFAADTNTLYRNLGPSQFKDVTVGAGLATVTRFVGWGTDFLDVDRDGWPDLFLANGHIAPSVDGAASGAGFAQPRLLFWNRGDGIFHPLSGEAGPGLTEPRPSRGSAVGDLDNDGDLEIVVANLDQSLSLLQNRVEPAGNWISVRALTRAGGDAVGARVTLVTQSRTLVSEVRSGGSYLSQGDFRQHFGVGEETSARVEVRWPTGTARSARTVEANQLVTFVEPRGNSGAPTRDPQLR